MGTTVTVWWCKVADSTGINRFTGQALSDWDHVIQSLFVIFQTLIGTRVMRRTFGSAVPGLLGKNLTPPTMLNFFTAIIIAIVLWEPRFRVIQIIYPQPPVTPDTVRAGLIEFQIVGAYRPRALQGDLTEEPVPRVATVTVQAPS